MVILYKTDIILLPPPSCQLGLIQSSVFTERLTWTCWNRWTGGHPSGPSQVPPVRAWWWINFLCPHLTSPHLSHSHLKHKQTIVGLLLNFYSIAPYIYSSRWSSELNWEPALWTNKDVVMIFCVFRLSVRKSPLYSPVSHKTGWGALASLDYPLQYRDTQRREGPQVMYQQYLSEGY